MKYLNRDHVIYKMSPENEAACHMEDGDTITVRTYDCFKDQLLQEGCSLDQLITQELNPATGPIFVNNAHPGDTLKVEILKIRMDSMGVTEIDPLFGCLAHLVKEPVMKYLKVQDGVIDFNDQLKLACQPMIGVIGVAPANESVATDTPGNHGGNMDCTQIKEGSTVYFPVGTEGALLSLGDLHACMGDGEIGGCGVEIPGEVTLKVTVIPKEALDYPVVVTRDEVMVLASESNVEEAWKKAVENLYDYMSQNTRLTSSEIIMLLSLAGNLSICQTVNPKKTVRMSMPLQYMLDCGFRPK